MSEVQPPDPNSEPPVAVPTPPPPAPDSPWNQTKAAWRTLRIQILRTTIRGLQSWLDQLETIATTSAPGTVSATQESWLITFWALLVSLWGSLLAGMRTLLPPNWSQRLSDPLLSGALVGVIVLVFWGTTSLFRGQPTQVALAPQPSSDASTPTIVTPAPEPAPVVEFPEPVVEAPTPLPEPAPEPAPVVETPPATAPIETPVAQEPIVPSEPSPVAPAVLPAQELIVPTPAAEVQPILKAGEPGKPPDIVLQPVLTPEQSLISSIQAQVVQVTSQYADGLIQSIQANFPGSRLTVRVKNRWYELETTQQDKLAKDIFQQARSLEFTKLDILDDQGSLLARNPLVGEEMIILKRSLG